MSLWYWEKLLNETFNYDKLDLKICVVGGWGAANELLSVEGAKRPSSALLFQIVRRKHQ